MSNESPLVTPTFKSCVIALMQFGGGVFDFRVQTHKYTHAAKNTHTHTRSHWNFSHATGARFRMTIHRK